MKVLLTCFALLVSVPSFCQLGINFRYQNLDSEKWEGWTKEDQLFSRSYELGLDYWFRLKNYRVEFMPEIYHYRSKTSTVDREYGYSSFGFAGNTNFYILDFIGDCDCPTFSKDGNFFTKGFYLSASPLIEYQNKKIGMGSDAEESYTSFGYGAAIGAGVDIGITDLITISPFVRYKFLPNTKWDTLAVIHAEVGEETTNTTLGFLQVGIRLGFRPDYVREQNKYRFRR